MPLGIPNAPGSAIALSYVARAFSITVSDGGASGLEAIALGARLLEGGRADVCLVVSAFSRCQELLLSAQRAGHARARGALRVFDREAHGTAFGEVAAALVLERAADASARGARPVKAACSATPRRSRSDAAQVDERRSRARCTDALRRAHVEPGTARPALPRRQRPARARCRRSARADRRARPCGRAPAGGRDQGQPRRIARRQRAAAGRCSRSARCSAGKAPKIANLAQPAQPGLRYALETTALTPARR